MSKEEIKADIERHIRHCAMRHNTTQDVVIGVMKEILLDNA